MASAQPEKRITMISTGHLPSSKLLELSASRPFVHQVDIIFPFDSELEAAFSKLETDYSTSRAPLAEIYEALRTYGNQEPDLTSFAKSDGHDAHVASTSAFLPDAWSSREGSVILSAGKETFEALGLSGTKFSSRMSGAPEQYLINLSLTTPSAKANANVRSHDFILDSFTRWDRSREESGEGQWDFAFHLSRPDKGTGPLSPSRARYHEVKPVIRKLQNVHIPTERHKSTNGTSKAGVDDDDDALQDWNERASALFEWVGMINIGAQRLQANDRVDPYVSVYSAPAPSTIGDMLHIQWHGLLTPQFVRRVVETATHVVTRLGDSFLIGLTIHGSTEVPVLQPHSVPRLEGEDTASVILTRGGIGDAAMISRSASNPTASWIIVESKGKSVG
ncbi:ribonuclease P 40kDa subunit-domain-containing protein [Lactifluus volemus]|nr:ribonuclease P 40kDa subunit-domain-containing protein [Lactifluus volemus]